MTEFPLRATLGALQKQMKVHFAEATTEIDHRGAKGREREALVAKRFLDVYLPNRVEVVHGAEIVDSLGSRSAECDLVVQDPDTPPLYLSETFRLIPAEWAHGIIEVKTNLDTAQLDDAVQKIIRAKRLEKLTFRPATGDVATSINAYGRQFSYFPMFGIVFAYTSIGLERLAARLAELQRDVAIEHQVDLVVVLDRGLLMYSDLAGGVSNRPMPGSELLAVASENPLLATTLAIQGAFGGVWLPPASLAPYLGPGGWGETVARFSTSAP